MMFQAWNGSTCIKKLLADPPMSDASCKAVLMSSCVPMAAPWRCLPKEFDMALDRCRSCTVNGFLQVRLTLLDEMRLTGMMHTRVCNHTEIQFELRDPK